jgi:demethylmenaquinone methyltransferase/2-methoxy-6-polyprenyl-1,4-benzoquinol methylase
MNNNNLEDTTTHFGFKQVEVQQKQGLVAKVFDDVATKYDLMNDLMSFGLHRIWKWLTCYLTDITPASSILDLAGGTGDLTKILAQKLNKDGSIILSDINGAMLSAGRDKLIDANIVTNVEYVQANAEHLPFADNSFDLVTMAFGLRNVTNKQQALNSIYRVLKPGGKLFVLEFSKPQSSIIAKAYDFYSFNIVPKIGEIVTGKKEHYDYLVESIRMHPDQEGLKKMFEQAGFDDCIYNNFHTGVVALHRGFKF